MNAIPEFIEPERISVSRTKSEDLTHPMHMIDHRLAKQDGPPSVIEGWDDDDTDVDFAADTYVGDEPLTNSEQKADSRQ